ncbi:kinesin-like protein [Plasmodium gonderi]|uniref:Kinesin-like protein n=1 Tax=Plasmodium gonderi TaxID=77519 RepID=A0A1Y1JJ63_PLAGO|nr:kinesin-like protein [Plasmodium gonderi]GAW81227.1 kinesin-like protein [Plasmodium gonderi]
MNENIKVFLRIKPNIDNFSKLKKEDCAIYKVNNNQLHLFEKKKSYNDTNELKTKIFNFNYIFDVDIKQSDIFELIGKNLINNFINGYNSSILAYGNTNSGKTYTLYGDRMGSHNNQNNGLIYFSLNYFFQLPNNAEISVSIVEIYLEKIRDLGKIFQLSQLATTTDDMIKQHSQFLDSIIREDEKGNTYVENITMLPIKNIDDVSNIIDLCFRYRKTYATKKNLVSSRSHCMLTVYQHQCVKEKELFSQINYIDLAGSEKFNDIEMVNKKELIYINNTLSILNRVIIALSTKNKIVKNSNKIKTDEQLKNEDCDSPNVHIPYRDSKLTRLLKNSLNGNSFTYILICLNLNSHKIEDFINSLIFAKRCKMIKQKIKKNKIAKCSSQSDSSRSNPSSDENSYESFDSNFEDYNLLVEENKSDHTCNFETHFYNKRKNKYKTVNNSTDAMVNKLLILFTHIIQKKYRDLVKQKNSIINNLIKIIKSEENNKEELKANKNYLEKILKKKKKELIKNKQYLNHLIHSKEDKAKTIVKNNHSQPETYVDQNLEPEKTNQFSSNASDESHSHLSEIENEDTMFCSPKEKHIILNTVGGNVPIQNQEERQNDINMCSQNKEKDISASSDIIHSFICMEGKEKEEEEESPSSTNEINLHTYDNLIKNTNDIKQIHADIDKLFKMEVNKLNEKIKILIKLNFTNISLFINVNKLANILQNIYQKKYSVCLKNGKKTLNITNYDYNELKKSYDFFLPTIELDNQTNDKAFLKGFNKNVVSMYREINAKK